MKKVWVIVILLFVFVILGVLLFCYKDKLNFKSMAIFSENTSNTEEIEKSTTTTTTTKVNDERAKTSKGFVIEQKEGVTYIDGILIVNKTYKLPETYIPTDTYKPVNNQDYCQSCINKEAYEAFKEMKADALALGLNIYISSGYRSYEAQSNLYQKYIKDDGLDAANTYSAKPGHSEHQTGLAFDLNSITDDFATTKEGVWVAQNAYKYGFVIRYPKDKEDITGYKYESWHLRYLNKTLAETLYNDGDWITLEEYFGIDSQYND